MKQPSFDFKFLSGRQSVLKKGFTLPELLVVIAIVGILSGVLIFGYRDFNDSTILTNLAYDIALSVRQVQTSGSSGAKTPGNAFDRPYGIHFDSDEKENKSYLTFIDTSPFNYIYDKGKDPVQKSFSIGKGNFIKEICRVKKGEKDLCDTNSKQVDIIFVRPKLDATILFNGGSKSNYEGVKIFLESPQGRQRCLVVLNTGLISVSRDCAS